MTTLRNWLGFPWSERTILAATIVAAMCLGAAVTLAAVRQ